jgi:hypothetical protein
MYSDWDLRVERFARGNQIEACMNRYSVVYDICVQHGESLRGAWKERQAQDWSVIWSKVSVYKNG